MIKTKNDDAEVMTKGWFREAMRESIDEFARIVNKSFVEMESRMDARFGKIESTMATKEDILTLTQRIDKLEKYVNNRFDSISRELKEIRKEIKAIDVRADIFELRSRVTKLEQKAGM
jgi:polyhydroxyalkanoate synthesis regulator phasin